MMRFLCCHAKIQGRKQCKYVCLDDGDQNLKQKDKQGESHAYRGNTESNRGPE